MNNFENINKNFFENIIMNLLCFENHIIIIITMSRIIIIFFDENYTVYFHFKIFLNVNQDSHYGIKKKY